MNKPTSKPVRSEAEKACLARVNRAKAKRDYEESVTVGVYAPKFKSGAFGVPYYAKSDALAAVAFRESIDCMKEECLIGTDLYYIGNYRLDIGKISARNHRHIPY